MEENREENIFEQKERKEQFGDLIIYTTTFYGDDEVSKVRSKLAEKFLSNTENLNIKCVVIDGGSNKEFTDKAREFCNVEFLINPALKMGESRREALKIGMSDKDAQYFLWVEPEKFGLITEESLSAMIESLRKNQADIVVPKRKTKDTLPKLQSWIESRANRRATNIMQNKPETEKVKEEIDLWFGPKMFNRAGAEYFLNYKGKLDKWDSIIKPVIDARKDGKNISSVEVDYDYDITQTQIEEDNNAMKKKRLVQYTQILKELGDSFWEKR